MNRPRVTANYELPAETLRTHGGRQWTSPDVLVTVSFDLHEHEAALKALERAVADVRAQIEETQGDVIERNRAAFEEEIREAHTIARRRESQ